jgi:acetoin utilization protein AcuB
MYVGLKMKTKVVTVTPKTLLIDCHDIMEENRLWMLPVVKNEKLVGYVKKEDVRAALPSQATMLSRHELHTVFSTVTIKDLIDQDVVTVTPETEIEAAAELMAQRELPGLAVVDSGGKLVGYINRRIMLEVLVEEMGLHRGGKRFAIKFKDRPGVMADVSGIISDMGINFLSAASFFIKDDCILVFRVQTDDVAPIIEILREREYELVGPEYFKETQTPGIVRHQ